MIARLAEGFYFAKGSSPSAEDIDFLLRELRTPELLLEAVSRFPEAARELVNRRPAVQAALDGDRERIAVDLRAEQDDAVLKDRLWREPLRRELEQFRHQR